MSFGPMQESDFVQQGQGGSPPAVTDISPTTNVSKQKSTQQPEVLSLKLTANPSESPNTP